MKSLRNSVVGSAALVLFMVAPAAQKSASEQFLVPIPEKLERATVTDAQGAKQWAPYKAERCVNCKGRAVMACLHCERFDPGDCDSCPECKNTKEATCRVCYGTGEMADVLERAPCPTCFGAALTRCFVCGGRGKFPVQGGGERPQKCSSCDATGAYPCTTCGGKRYVELPALKPSAAEAPSAELKKALAALDAVEAALRDLQSTGDGRKDAKAFAKVGAAGGKYLPVMKKVQKHFETVSRAQSKGATWVQYPEMVQNQMETARHALDYWIKHQRRVLQLCLARAEHNESVLAEQEKKK
ncbi:MAG TPA: hypothetical protein VK081_07150 [Planctomycetota bacterium]|nr:hypothetical protein [Planctomycetota bacterium]